MDRSRAENAAPGFKAGLGVSVTLMLIGLAVFPLTSRVTPVAMIASALLQTAAVAALRPGPAALAPWRPARMVAIATATGTTLMLSFLPWPPHGPEVRSLISLGAACTASIAIATFVRSRPRIALLCAVLQGVYGCYVLWETEGRIAVYPGGGPTLMSYMISVELVIILCAAWLATPVLILPLSGSRVSAIPPDPEGAALERT